jgi:broad specificity phosphatase PhoE
MSKTQSSNIERPVRLVLVRHGETVGNSAIRYYGRMDVELSELGKRQMEAVRGAMLERFGNCAFNPVIASPLRRARQSSLIITGREPVPIDDFAEVDFGDFEGLTAEEIRERFPAQFARWDRERFDPGYAYPNGESRAAFIRRVDRGIAQTLGLIDNTHHEYPSAALVVAHRGVIRAITQRLADAAPSIELASIHLLSRRAGDSSWTADLLDDVTHLEGLGR